MSDNAPEHAKVEKIKFVLPDGLYVKTRYFVNYVIPAGAALYAGLGILYGFPDGDRVVGAAGLVVIFLNVLLGKSQTNYTDQKEQQTSQNTLTQGTAYVNTFDPDSAVVGIDLEGLNPLELASKKTLTLKVDHKGPDSQ